GGHLVEQRLEGVVVVPVDQHDLDRRVSQPTHRRQSRKAAADDRDARACGRRCGRFCHQTSVTPALLKGGSYTTLPPSCAMALATAGAMGGVPGSPTPEGG